MTTEQSPPRAAARAPSSLGAWTERLTIAALLVVPAALATAFAWPWLPAGRSGSLERYAPVRDGAAASYAVYDGAGALQSWQSDDVAVVPGVRAIARSDLRDAQRHDLSRLYARTRGPGTDTGIDADRLARARVQWTTTRQVRRAGDVGTTVTLTVRDAGGGAAGALGDLLLTLSDPTADVDYSFDPAIVSLPADLHPGRTWTQRGAFGAGTYTFRGRVLGPVAIVHGGRTLRDCLAVETRRTIALGEKTVGDDRWRATYCAGIGLVEKLTLDSAGRTTQRRVLLAAGDSTRPPPAPLVASSTAPTAMVTDPARWRLALVAAFGQDGAVYESTIAPTVVPTDPALLLVAGHGGDLIAYDARAADGTVRWTFRPGGTVYGPPAWDATGGRLYFGASDKRLYALDARGVFLWSVATGDNVATRPVVVRDVVVFGSEDHHVYGVDARTGHRRWRVRTGAAVVSSPASVDGLVVVGSDDQTVRAIDPATGRVRWSGAMGGAIEAPVAGVDGVAYVAARDGSLGTWRVADGTPLWTASLRAPLRTMPLVLGDAVYLVTAAGDVRAVQRASGARRWVSVAAGYVGPPVELGGMPLVARTDGVVEALDPRTGRAVRTWARPDVAGRTRASVSLGPGIGAGALWLADRAPAVWRLGAGGVASLPLAWTHVATDAPFSGRPLWTTPLPFAGHAVVLDEAGAIFLADVRTGETMRIGALPPDAAYALAEPIVHGDTLLVAAGRTLHAFHLPDGRALWRFAADGSSLRPPAVAGGTVLWTTQASFDGPTTRGRLHALDLATGRPRWSADLASLWMAAEPVVRDDVVYLGTPPSAWDLGTGRLRWSSPLAPSAVGAPALVGDRLVVSAVDVAAGMGVVLGLDAATGRPRWRTPLGAGELPHPRERLWTAAGVVVVASSSGRIIGLDAATGRERWRHTPAAPRFGAITVADGRVIFVQQDGRVISLDAGSGAATVHATGLDALAAVHGRFQRPFLADDRLLLATGRALLGFTLERP